MARANVCGKRIKLLRIHREMGQVELAAALEVDFNIKSSQSDISEIERGVRGVRDEEIMAFAKILDASPMWLLFGKKQPIFNNDPLEH